VTRPAARPKLTDAEWKVMTVVWHAGRASARDVSDALSGETGWAYTTVKTLLTRLAAKGAVRESEDRRGASAVYEPLVTADQARRSAVRTLLDRAFSGDRVPMVGFLLEGARLTADDRERLRRILDASERRGKRP
jgi:BlaI family penicillinase repressor